MRHIRNKCPHCGGAYDFTEEESGRESSCPHCGAAVRLRYKKSVGEHLWDWVLRGLMVGGILLAIWCNQLLTVITSAGFVLLLLGLHRGPGPSRTQSGGRGKDVRARPPPSSQPVAWASSCPPRLGRFLAGSRSASSSTGNNPEFFLVQRPLGGAGRERFGQRLLRHRRRISGG